MAFSASSTATAPTVASPLVCQLPNLPPPFPKPSYEEEWKKNPDKNQTVFGLAWRDRYLVAITSSGSVCIWDTPLTENEEDESETLWKRQRPVLKVQVTSGALYSIQFFDSDQKTFMFVCGDEGVWGYDWKHWLQFLEGNTSVAPNVWIHCKPNPSPYNGAVEINDFDFSGKFIFGAAGDAFGGYKWDMETQKLLANYPSAKRGYLHTIKCMENGTVLMGGEDRVMGIWDSHHDTLIDNVDLKLSIEMNPSLVRRESNTVTWDANTNLWISHIHSLSDNWWTVCGGTAKGGGHLTCWHAPTRSLVAGCMTRETPQFACSSPTSLVTVADEGVVSHWSQPQLERKHRVWCSPPSSFAVTLREKDNKLAVGGVGNHVDIFDNMTDKVFSLTVVDTSGSNVL